MALCLLCLQSRIISSKPASEGTRIRGKPPNPSFCCQEGVRRSLKSPFRDGHQAIAIRAGLCLGSYWPSSPRGSLALWAMGTAGDRGNQGKQTGLSMHYASHHIRESPPTKRTSHHHTVRCRTSDFRGLRPPPTILYTHST